MEATNSSSYKCFNNTYLEALVITRTSIAGLSFIFTLFTTVLGGIFTWNKTVSERLLMIYLQLISMVYSLAVASQYIVLHYDDSNTGYVIGCQVVGFFTFVFSWMVLIVIFCIALHLLMYLYCFTLRTLSMELRRCLEAFYVLLMIFGPFLFVCWPFIKGYYGLDSTGTWCFIKSHSTSNCTGIDWVSITEHLVLYYIWRCFLLIFALASVLAVILGFARGRVPKTKCGTVVALLVYLVLQVLCTLIILVVRAISWAISEYEDIPSFVLSIADPLQGLFAGITLVVYICYQIRAPSDPLEEADPLINTPKDSFDTVTPDYDTPKDSFDTVTPDYDTPKDFYDN